MKHYVKELKNAFVRIIDFSGSLKKALVDKRILTGELAPFTPKIYLESILKGLKANLNQFKVEQLQSTFKCIGKGRY